MFFKKDKEPKPEYDGPPSSEEPSFRTLATSAFTVSILACLGLWQIDRISELGEEYWNNTIVPTAEIVYDTVIYEITEHPWQWGLKAFAVLIGSALVWKHIFKRVLGDKPEDANKNKWAMRVFGWIKSITRNI